MKYREPLHTGEVYHVYSKSIAGYRIFNNQEESERFKTMFYYCHFSKRISFSNFIKNQDLKEHGFIQGIRERYSDVEPLVQIVAYCVMHTHFHLIVKQLQDHGISKFMNDVLNGYTKYFNLKHKRKGPLWEGRFRSVHVKTDEQILHLTRYIHLNPATSSLCELPEDWEASSYLEYIGRVPSEDCVCEFRNLMSIQPDEYKLFVNSYIDPQRERAKAVKADKLINT